jgi:diguanylate cyclase (GGDEF)-like protein/PAS domain S-box-containing protein
MESIDGGNANVENQTVALKSYTYSSDNQSIHAELSILNSLEHQPDVILSLTAARTTYINGMKSIPFFSMFNTIIMALLFFIIYKELSKHLTKPFVRVIEDVQEIEFTENKTSRIVEKDKYEFLFLRRTINKMLEKIEGEQNKVRNSEERLYSTLVSVGDGVITIGTDSRIQLINPIAQQLTGWSQKEAFGRRAEEVFRIFNEFTREQVESPVSQVFRHKKIVQLSNHTVLISKDGTERPIEDTAAPIKDTRGAIIGCVLVFKDVSEKKEKQKYIEYLSYHDQLTGLYNRRFFEEEIRRLDAARNLPISFVYADINGLKIMNDAFGHEKGDEMIKQVAELIKKECRADDIFARTGGDEFILLLPKTDPNMANRIIERIKKAVKRISIMNISLSISFGWATKTSGEQDIEEILKNAEDLMYQRKILSNHSKRSIIIKSILNALLVKNEWEEAHSRRVSELCEMIGKAYGLEDDEVRELRLAGTLHDIGKIALDDDILNKTDKLTESDWAKIKKHPETGYRILGTSSEFYNISEYVLAHHEKWDGTGYPIGLKESAIPLKARMISIADAYDAMTCDRPYRKAFSSEEAVDQIRRNAGTQFDPDVAKVFVEKVLGINW